MKSVFSSKAFWLNIIMLALFILQLIDMTVLDMFHISAATSGKILAALGIVTTVLNYILRLYFTNEPVTKIAQDKLKNQPKNR